MNHETMIPRVTDLVRWLRSLGFYSMLNSGNITVMTLWKHKCCLYFQLAV
jgi:hypothetical protein